jgi:hypothetical protein
MPYLPPNCSVSWCRLWAGRVGGALWRIRRCSLRVSTIAGGRAARPAVPESARAHSSAQHARAPPAAPIATRGDSGRSGVRDRQMRGTRVLSEPRCAHRLECTVWPLPCAVARAQRHWCAGPRGGRRASMRSAMITHAFAWQSTMASTRIAARGSGRGRGGVVRRS